MQGAASRPVVRELGGTNSRLVIAPAGTAQRGYETCLQTLRATYGISASA